MKIYLAGGLLGNLSGGWKKIAENMKIYLAGTSSRVRLYEDLFSWGNRKTNFLTEMKIYLAGEHPIKNGNRCNECLTGRGDKLCILESYYSLRNNIAFTSLIPHLDLLLDSGAFSYMQGAKVENWDVYIEEYANFINKYKIERFFELDIDSLVGLNEVERLRSKLEKLTNRPAIPVWHKSRGKDYFLKMCREYNYVAIGGIVTQEIPRQEYERLFPWFINTAHRNGTKIHGLGYTGLNNLPKFHFDSVDSTAWLYGNRGGYLYKFDKMTGKMNKIDAPQNHRLKSEDAARWNFKEWIKLQEYAKKYL